MTPRELNRLRRERRYSDGDCVACGTEPRIGDGVLGEACREANNARRRRGGQPGWPKGKPRKHPFYPPLEAR